MIVALVQIVALCDGRKDHAEANVGADFRATSEEMALSTAEANGWFLGSVRGDRNGNDLCPKCHREAREFADLARAEFEKRRAAKEGA